MSWRVIGVFMLAFAAGTVSHAETLADRVRDESEPAKTAPRRLADYQAAMYDLLESSMREQYLAVGHRDATWDDMMLECIRRYAAHRVSGDHFHGLAHEQYVDWPTFRELLHRVGDTECEDPLWWHINAAMLGGNDEWQADALKTVFDGFAERGYQGLPMMLALQRRIDHLQDTGGDWRSVARRLADVCLELARRPGLDEMQQAAWYMLVADMINDELAFLEPEWQAEEYERYKANPTPHEWVREMLLAKLATELSWGYRGERHVTQLGWDEVNRRSRRYMEIAGNHAERALEVNDRHPHATAMLVSIRGINHETADARLIKAVHSLSDYLSEHSPMLGLFVRSLAPHNVINDPASDPGVKWLAETIARVPDWVPAFEAYESVWSRRSGTTPMDRWELAMAALDAERFDTLLPEVFWGIAHRARGGTVESLDIYEWMQAGLYERQRLAQEPPFWTHPEVWSAFERYFGGRLIEPYPIVGYDRRMKTAPAVAWACGRYAAAARWIESLGDDFDASVFRDYGGADELSASECFARADARIAYILGHVTLGRPVEANEALSERIAVLLTELPADFRGRLYLETLRAQGEWNAALVNDEPFVLIGPDRGDLSGWMPRSGVWSIDEQGRVTGESEEHEHYSGLGLMCPLLLSTRMELQGQLTVVEGNNRTNATIMFDFWENDYRHKYRSVAFYPDRDEVYVAQDGYLRRAEFPAELGRTIRFRIARLDDKVWVQINGERVAEEAYLPGSAGRYPGRIAIGGAYWKAGVKLRFDLLAARKIDEPPGWTTPAPIAPGS